MASQQMSQKFGFCHNFRLRVGGQTFDSNFRNYVRVVVS